MPTCPHTRCSHRNRAAARFCARCGARLPANSAPPAAAEGNPLLTTGWFFVAALLTLGGAWLLLTGGPVLFGLALIVFSCTALSPREGAP